MTGKQALGLEDEGRGRRGDAPPGGSGTDADKPVGQYGGTAKRRGGRSQRAGGRRKGHWPGTIRRATAIAQLRHLVSELIKGAEKKNGEQA